MERIIDFVTNHWELIALCLLSLTNILVGLLKKNKVIDNNLTGLLTQLPCIISDAEKSFGAGNGTEKLKYVFKQCVLYLVNVTGDPAEKVIQVYGTTITTAIENILATPNKKGA